VEGRHGYVSATDGLHIFDLARPGAPREVARYESLTHAGSVALGRTYVVVLESHDTDGLNEGALHVFDIADPTNPRRLGAVRLNRPGALDVGDRYAVVTSGEPRPERPSEPGVYIVDLANPAHPTVVGTAIMPPSWRIALNGALAYMVAPGVITILDLSDPTHPVEVSRLGTGSQAGPVENEPWRGVAVNGSYLYVGANDRPPPGSGGQTTGKLLVFDVSNPAKPVRIASVPSSPYPDTVAIRGRHAYVSGLGLRVFDVADPRNPREIGRFDGSPCPRFEGVSLDGGRAYGVTQFAGLRILDVSDPSAPKHVLTDTTIDWTIDATAAARGFVYVVDTGGLRVYRDAVPPDAPGQHRQGCPFQQQGS
jgi:hypothetical protein